MTLPCNVCAVVLIPPWVCHISAWLNDGTNENTPKFLFLARSETHLIIWSLVKSLDTNDGINSIRSPCFLTLLVSGCLTLSTSTSKSLTRRSSSINVAERKIRLFALVNDWNLSIGINLGLISNSLPVKIHVELINSSFIKSHVNSNSSDLCGFNIPIICS